MSAGSFTGNLHVLGKRPQARILVSKLGRFGQPDSIVPGAANPQNLNRYSYVLNSPVNFTDPTGHFCESGQLTDTGYCINSNTTSSGIIGAYAYQSPQSSTCDDSANTHLPACMKDPAPLTGDAKDRGGDEGSASTPAKSSLCSDNPAHAGCGDALKFQGMPYGLAGTNLPWINLPEEYSLTLYRPYNKYSDSRFPYEYAYIPQSIATSNNGLNSIMGLATIFNVVAPVIGTPLPLPESVVVGVSYSPGSSISGVQVQNFSEYPLSGTVNISATGGGDEFTQAVWVNSMDTVLITPSYSYETAAVVTVTSYTYVGGGGGAPAVYGSQFAYGSTNVFIP